MVAFKEAITGPRPVVDFACRQRHTLIEAHPKKGCEDYAIF